MAQLSSSKDRSTTLLEIIGWISVLLIISAYALVSFQLLTSDSLLYQFTNILGAVGLITHSIMKRDFQPAVLNVVWALIALIAIIRLV